jgi:hypothetical protein
MTTLGVSTMSGDGASPMRVYQVIDGTSPMRMYHDRGQSMMDKVADAKQSERSMWWIPAVVGALGVAVALLILLIPNVRPTTVGVTTFIITTVVTIGIFVYQLWTTLGYFGDRGGYYGPGQGHATFVQILVLYLIMWVANAVSLLGVEFWDPGVLGLAGADLGNLLFTVFALSGKLSFFAPGGLGLHTPAGGTFSGNVALWLEFGFHAMNIAYVGFHAAMLVLYPQSPEGDDFSRDMLRKTATPTVIYAASKAATPAAGPVDTSVDTETSGATPAPAATRRTPRVRTDAMVSAPRESSTAWS